jgi:DNA-binding transcriptional ArsR family regulator
MDFFKALFELLGSSRRWVFAIFIASAGFLTPSLINRFGPDPKWDIHWCVVGLLFLTGGFLITIVLEQVLAWLSVLAKKIRIASYNITPLSELEEAILYGLGHNHATSGYDIDDMHGTTELTKLEMVHAVEKLRKRGLVASYRGYPTHIYLTSKGRPP